MNNSENITTYRKKIKYKSLHRGCKELDIIFSGFVDNFLYILSKDEIIEYSKILDCDDVDIFDWITAKTIPPRHISRKIIQLLNNQYNKTCNNTLN